MQSIWPWAEANQGLLSAIQGVFSIVALVVALIAIRIELGGRNRERREDAKAFHQDVVGYGRWAAKAASAILDQEGRTVGDLNISQQDWRRFCRNAKEVADELALLQERSPNAEIRSAIADLVSHLQDLDEGAQSTITPRKIRIAAVTLRGTLRVRLAKVGLYRMIWADDREPF